MPDLPARPDLDHLHRQANDLFEVAKHRNLASAQLAVAREYGFASWARLQTEVERRRILDDRDVDRLSALLIESPELAVEEMEHWCDHPRGAAPLNYVA